MAKSIKENQIMVVIKEPGKAPVVEPLFNNTLKAFQEAVGGYIETVTLASDLVIICNEEGRIYDLPHNCNICGVDFVGSVVAVGCKGDEFTSIKAQHIPYVLKLLAEREG